MSSGSGKLITEYCCQKHFLLFEAEDPAIKTLESVLAVLFGCQFVSGTSMHSACGFSQVAFLVFFWEPLMLSGGN